MKLQEPSNFKEVNKVLVGLESLEDNDPVLPRIRFALETLTFNRADNKKLFSDFFSLIKSIGDFPVTSLLEQWVFSQNKSEELISILKIFEYFSDHPQYENFRLIMQNAIFEEKYEEKLENLLKKLVHSFCDLENQDFRVSLQNLLLEKGGIEKIRKMLSLYQFLYDESYFSEIKSGYDRFLSETSYLKFFDFLATRSPDSFMATHVKVAKKFQDLLTTDALSKGQVQSKLWAIKTLEDLGLKDKLPSILLLCGWYGVFFAILESRWSNSSFKRLRSVDIDPRCEKISELYNQDLFLDNWRFKAITDDIQKIKYSDRDEKTCLSLSNKQGRVWNEWTKFDIIINTSCEHIEEFTEWYEKLPQGQLLLLQSNDYFDCEGHVNCVNSTADFRERTPMTKRLFSGALPLGKYTRYMVIGYK